MSRKDRHSRSSKKIETEKVGEFTSLTEEGETNQLPPRRKKFPSSLNKVHKWYYNLLFILFVCLVVFLFWYGNKFSS
ncbi:hypothetical protein ACFQZE_02555 [Paenibacillus sp. GCM10027627]|uniref:hypothetical protein n=1 Tax=unclassified Paenibacillus TaxID=185978 RepID=UPI0036424820